MVGDGNWGEEVGVCLWKVPCPCPFLPVYFLVPARRLASSVINSSCHDILSHLGPKAMNSADLALKVLGLWTKTDLSSLRPFSRLLSQHRKSSTAVYKQGCNRYFKGFVFYWVQAFNPGPKRRQVYKLRVMAGHQDDNGGRSSPRRVTLSSWCLPYLSASPGTLD